MWPTWSYLVRLWLFDEVHGFVRAVVDFALLECYSALLTESPKGKKVNHESDRVEVSERET